MEMKEFSGKTVEKALQAACEHFGLKEEDLEVEIITKGSTGLFGLGSRPAKIKAAPKAGMETAEEGTVPETEPEEGRASGEERKAEEEKTPPASESKEQEGGEAAPSGDESEEKEEKIDEEGGRTEPGPEQIKAASRQEPAAPSYEELRRHVETAVEITNEILEKSGLSGSAEVGELDGKPVVNLTGQDLSLIIGKEGQTLDALEYIVNLALKRRSELNQRVVIEASGYRKRRQDSLIDLAHRMAHKAKKTGRAVVLQPMPARERRIIHMALKETRGIKTHSSGDGLRRKVIITPMRRGRNTKGRSQYNSQRNRRPRN